MCLDWHAGAWVYGGDHVRTPSRSAVAPTLRRDGEANTAFPFRKNVCLHHGHTWDDVGSRTGLYLRIGGDGQLGCWGHCCGLADSHV